ncbi:MAG: recombinase family protein [Beijerinckiaceae bacterium]|nr:recombinase family protein [Beijerinckiaceae bacterium]
MKIGYARVSTDEQNLDLQLHALGAAGCETVFQDHGLSGASSARPGLLAALEKAREGDTLTVWRIDRLGRSTLHLLQILDQLRSRNIGFQSIMDGIDTNTAAGRMVFSMVGAIAEFERSVISERTKAGMEAARRRGLHVGRPAKLAPEQLDDARRMIGEGASRAQAARALGVDPSTLRRLLMKG